MNMRKILIRCSREVEKVNVATKMLEKKKMEKNVKCTLRTMLLAKMVDAL